MFVGANTIITLLMRCLKQVSAVLFYFFLGHTVALPTYEVALWKNYNVV
jgi:hypothetical protein